MKFAAVVSALAVIGFASASPAPEANSLFKRAACSSGTYTYKKCKFNTACNAVADGQVNYTYQNVTSFTSCLQQCLTGEFACDAANYNGKAKTCALILNPSGTSTVKGQAYGEKTTSQACGNVG